MRASLLFTNVGSASASFDYPGLVRRLQVSPLAQHGTLCGGGGHRGMCVNYSNCLTVH